jgi:hypothetical protein
MTNYELKANSSTMRYAGHLLDKYGAPKLSELTTCNAPALEEPPNYLGSFVLNSIFLVAYPELLGRLVLIFGRRVIHAVNEYRTGRELLFSYLEQLKQTNSHFLLAMRATTYFEHCIASLCQAAALLGRIQETVQPDLQVAEKDEREERLIRIWNRSKHFDEDIVAKKLANADITAPVWLTNEGISSEKASVTFDELHSVLSSLLDALRFFAVDFPKRRTDAAAKPTPEEA